MSAAVGGALRVDGVSIAIDGHRVVDDVSFVVDSGRAVALVGESGSGKTLTALSLLRLLPSAARVVGGRVVVDVPHGAHGSDNVDVFGLDEPALRRVRGGVVGMVFQEPLLALDPLQRVDDAVGEALRVHKGASKKEARAQASTLLTSLGLPTERTSTYPHALSGGQRQRVMLASALSASPRFLIADEPTTALDVTVQRQILELLRAQQRERGLGLLLITHDLSVVGEFCDDVVVLYAGRVVEAGAVVDVFARPAHPYTKALLASSPSTATPGQPLPAIRGHVPLAGQWPSGCRFRDRCDRADDACAGVVDIVTVGDRRVRCVHPWP